jgi:thiol:disulfide interchange protein
MSENTVSTPNARADLRDCRPLRRTRRSFIVALCALLGTTAARAATETSPLPTRFDPARDPARDLDTALRIARVTRRRVLAEVGGEWCTWCHIMDRFFAANPELAKLRDTNYIVLRINFSKENKNQAFLSRWPKVAGYPHFFVLDANGKLLHSQDTSALEAPKDYDPVAFRKFLLEWAPR